MTYSIKIEDENGAVVAKHEISESVMDLIVETIHNAAVNGMIDSCSVSAAVTGAASISSAAKL